jgi:amidase
MNRRDFMRLGAAGIAAASWPSTVKANAAAVDVVELSIAEMQERMSSGSLTALQLVNAYIRRIEDLDHSSPNITSVIEINPDARDIARALDAERGSTGPRGPLHGIPILFERQY